MFPFLPIESLQITARISIQALAGQIEILRRPSHAHKSCFHEKGPFLTDVKEVRRRARQQIMDGAVTSDYRGDRETVVRVLNQALATEIVCEKQ